MVIIRSPYNKHIMAITINRWGNPLVSPFGEDYEPYIIDKATDGVVYTCYTNAAKRVIWREKTVSGVTTREFSYGPWDQRATLTYVPINSSLDVEA